MACNPPDHVFYSIFNEYYFMSELTYLTVPRVPTTYGSSDTFEFSYTDLDLDLVISNSRENSDARQLLHHYVRIEKVAID